MGPSMGYLLTLLAALLAGGGYFVAWRRGRERESSLKTALDQRTEELTLAEQELIRKTPGDPVTGLPTQQTFQEFLEHEWRRAARARTPVSLLLLELDHFKAYDERLGSSEGEACMKSVAAALKPIPHRPGDLLARYGHGRFGVILGSTDAAGAQIIAERLRQAVEVLKHPNPMSTTAPHLTATIGVASATPDREAPWQDIELLASAERALSTALEAGRNRVV